MVIHRNRRHFWTATVSLTVIAFVYVTLNHIPVDNYPRKVNSYNGGVKNVVAYSLLKQIEIESEHFNCQQQLNSSDLNYHVISERVGGYNNRNNNNNDWWKSDDGMWTNIDGTELYVFSVHLDKRLEPYHYVRMIGMVRGTFQETVYCQVSTPANALYVTKVTITPIWLDIWDQNDTNIYFNPVLLSCQIPSGLTPNRVSVTTTPCDSKKGKAFQIIDNGGKRQNNFTVCVKPLNFLENISERLIQWIEISRILGAEKIEIYVEKVTKSTWNILKWYSSTYPKEIIIRKFKTVTKATEKKHNFSKNLWQKRRYEVITYNSCFYRNIETSRFVVPLDIDEIIVSKPFFTWKNILEHIFTSSPELEQTFASFMVPNAYFFGKLPNKEGNRVFFLENLLRSDFSPPGESGKSFVSTKNTLTVFNHYSLDVLKPGVSRTIFLSSSVVQLNHYKEICDTMILPECVKYVSSHKFEDTSILKYKNLFMNVYLERFSMLHKLGLCSK